VDCSILPGGSVRNAYSKIPVIVATVGCLIMNACNMNMTEIKMPEAEAFFDEPRSLALAQAIEQGDVKVIRENASDLDINQPHVRGMTYLNWAVAHLNYDSAEALLALGADSLIETEGSSPLSLALNFEDIRWLKLFVDSGADINTKRDDSPLWFSAIPAKNGQHIDYLLSKGLDVNASNGIGHTAIFKLAAYRAYGQVLNFIENGADVHAVSVDGLSFARRVQERDVATGHPEYENREQVIKILAKEGYRFQ